MFISAAAKSLQSCLTPCDPKEGRGNGTPLQSSRLENLMDGGAWGAAVHAVTKSQTHLSNFNFTFTFMHWRRKWQPTPEFLPGKSHGQRSLEGYSPWGLKNSYTTEATELMSKWIAWLLTWALRVQLAIKALPVMHCGRRSLFKVSLLLLGLHSQGCGQISLANIQWWKWYDGTRIASLLHDKLGTALSLNSPMCFSKCFLM